MIMDSACLDPSRIGDVDRSLARAGLLGDSEALAAILSLGHCSPEGCERAFINATQQGHARCVEQLIPFCDPRANDSLALRIAVITGSPECVKILIPHSNLEGEEPALLAATFRCRLDCIALLAPESSAEVNRKARELAAMYGFADALLLLISPQLGFVAELNGQQPLENAAKQGHAECVQLLLPVSPSLMDEPSPLREALHSGKAESLALMLAHEPSLHDIIDFAAARAEALRSGHVNLAQFIDAIVDARCLSGLAFEKGAEAPIRSTRI